MSTGKEEVTQLATRADDTTPSAETIGRLWTLYWLHKDQSSRNLLLVIYEPLIQTVVRRLPISIRANADDEDLRSFGLFGLIDAIDKCDAATDPARFPAYASYRIRGAIIDELRGLDWLPRSIRRRMITYRTTVDELSNELGRPPVPAEVFSSMNLDHRQGTRLLQDVENAQVVRLQRWKPDDEGGSFDQLVIDNAHQRDGDPEPHILASEELAQLREAISHLNDRQRTVVTLRYISGMTQQQVAEIIGVTNARICQIEGVALQRLREIFAESDLAETRVAVS